MTAPVPKKRLIVLVLLGALLVGTFAAAILVVGYLLLRERRSDPDRLRGGTLRYRLLFPEGFAGDRSAAAERTVDVLSRRLHACGVEDFGVSVRGNDFVSVEFHGIDRTAFQRCKALLALSSVELREAAPAGVRWKPGDPAPEGFAAVRNDHAAGGSEILVSRELIIDGADVESAGAIMDSARQAWIVEFALTGAGARKFDAAAARLFRQAPRGQIAILKNGRVISNPVVNDEKFGGRGQITGSFSREEAQTLAIVLQSGGLPVPIGRLENGVPEPGVPEFESYVDFPRR